MIKSQSALIPSKQPGQVVPGVVIFFCSNVQCFAFNALRAFNVWRSEFVVGGLTYHDFG